MPFAAREKEGLAEESRRLENVILFPIIFCFPFFCFDFRVHTHVYNTWGVLLVLFFLNGAFKTWTTDSTGMQYFVALARIPRLPSLTFL